jgi:hypothetical protein
VSVPSWPDAYRKTTLAGIEWARSLTSLRPYRQELFMIVRFLWQANAVEPIGEK